MSEYIGRFAGHQKDPNFIGQFNTLLYSQFELRMAMPAQCRSQSTPISLMNCLHPTPMTHSSLLLDRFSMRGFLSEWWVFGSLGEKRQSARFARGHKKIPQHFC